MSIQATVAVWEGSKHSGDHLVVLLACANLEDCDGIVYPLSTYVLGASRLSEERLGVVVDDLIESGELLPCGTIPETYILNHALLERRRAAR